MKKVLFLCGGSSDLGRTLIRRVYGEYDVILAHYCRHEEGLARLKEELEEEQGIRDRLVLLQGDLSSREDIARLTETCRQQEMMPTHFVYFPARQVKIEKFHKMKWEDMEADLSLQLRGAVLMLQQFLPAMAKGRYGKVVLTLSSCTAGTPPRYWTAYTTVKYAMLGLMKSLAAEYADKGVRVNGVSPSMIDTEFVAGLPHLILEQNQAEHPLKRLARPEDVAGVIQMLLSEQGDYISGENILISGGSVM